KRRAARIAPRSRRRFGTTIALVDWHDVPSPPDPRFHECPMSHPTDSSVTPQVLFQLLNEHRKLWIYPTLAVTLLALVATLLLPRNWEATQGLLIRPEVAGIQSDRLGKFSDLSEMKTLQETIFELARSQSVVTAALQ